MKSKGVTPVIAVVLLMTIAVAATSTAYQIINNAQSDVQSSFEDSFSQEELQRQSELNIEAIYEGSDGNAYMTVRNTGSVKQLVQGSEGQKYWTVKVDNAPIGGDNSGTDWDYVGDRSGQVILSSSSTININTGEVFPSENEEKKFELIGRYGSSDTYFCENTGSSSC